MQHHTATINLTANRGNYGITPIVRLDHQLGWSIICTRYLPAIEDDASLQRFSITDKTIAGINHRVCSVHNLLVLRIAMLC